MKWSVKVVWGILVESTGMWQPVQPSFGFTGHGRACTRGVFGIAEGGVVPWQCKQRWL